MRKAILVVCALFISFALLFLPSTEARAVLPGEVRPGPIVEPPKSRRCGGRYTPCMPPRQPRPRCGTYGRGRCPPPVRPTEP
ncbi:hypothetical protein NL676_014705 [Syzygium grande]|nr:hypothetical protein NL676_014705 [Syzygium grande]